MASRPGMLSAAPAPPPLAGGPPLALSAGPAAGAAPGDAISYLSRGRSDAPGSLVPVIAAPVGEVSVDSIVVHWGRGRAWVPPPVGDASLGSLVVNCAKRGGWSLPSVRPTRSRGSRRKASTGFK